MNVVKCCAMGQLCCLRRKEWWVWLSQIVGGTSEGTCYNNAARKPPKTKEKILAPAHDEGEILQTTQRTETLRRNLRDSSSSLSSTMPSTRSHIPDEIKQPLVNSNIVSRQFDHNGGVLNSKDGIKITFPNDAIKEGDFVSCRIVVDLCGPFVFLSKCQTNLVSPYYRIGVSESYHFHKPVQVEIECFAVDTDPSHYQLFSCKDDDESYTMRPVDCELSFTVRGNILLCTFYTDHFCSYCLLLKYKGPNKLIGAFCLKPANFQSLNSFKVEILFSYVTSHCINRIKDICKKKNMIVDEDNSFVFETPHKISESYVLLGYEQNNNGWQVHHSGPEIIDVKSVNFHEYYKEPEQLRHSEEMSLFPPRFIVNIKKDNCNHIKTLDSNITVTLYNGAEGKLPKIFTFKVYVPVSSSKINNSARISKENTSFSIPYHDCDINKVESRDLIKYSEKIADYWEDIAASLDIPDYKVLAINCDHLQVRKKSNEMFRLWLELQRTTPCWCKFIEALYAVGLNRVAEEAKTHLKHKIVCETSSDVVNVVEANMDIGSPDSPGTASSHTSRDEEGTSNSQIEHSEVTLHDLIGSMDLGSPDSPGTVTLDSSKDLGKSDLKTKDNALTLHDLVRHIRNIPDSDLYCFMQRLLPNDQIKSIMDQIDSKSLSSEDKVETVCKEILNQNLSWTELHRALTEAECNTPADALLLHLHNLC